MNTRTDLFKPNEKSVNLGIVIATAISFFVILLWEKQLTEGPFYANSTNFLLEHGALYGPRVFEGEWYRLITHLFLHSGMDHLVNNMLILYFVGNALERYLGRWRYLVLYFLSGILAGIGSIVYNMYQISYPVCIGASGAVFGVCGGLAYLVLVHKGNLEGLTKQRMIAFLALSVYGGLIDRGVDNAAHIAGLLAGFVMAALMYRRGKAE